jgi:hypothetical protein
MWCGARAGAARTAARAGATLADVFPTSPARPLPLVVAVVGAGLAGLALIALAVASLASNHGSFSGGVGIALVVYGAMMILAGWALWRRSLFGRGPVVALSLLNVAAGYTFTPSAPWVWVGVVVSAVTAVAAALPATSRALRLRPHQPQLSEADAPRPTDEQGR